MNPKQIKIFEKNKLQIVWNDGKESRIGLKYVREECPCASCKGETVLLKTYRNPQKGQASLWDRQTKQSSASPEMYKIKNIQTVGSYAIQITWGDGHNTGIYTWEYLLQLDRDQAYNKEQNYNDLI